MNYDDPFAGNMEDEDVRPFENPIAVQYIFDNPDGSQVLIDLWLDGTAMKSERPNKHTIWGWPVEGRAT